MNAENREVVKVLMVCLGNICRSPTAHGIFQERINKANLQTHITVDSAGTGSWHIGSCPDSRAIAAAGRRGYELAHLRARQVNPDDYIEFDYILAMDRDNLRNMQSECPGQHKNKLQLLLDYSDRKDKEVPDPYYSGGDGFELVLDMVEEAIDTLLQHLITRHSL